MTTPEEKASQIRQRMVDRSRLDRDDSEPVKQLGEPVFDIGFEPAEQPDPIEKIGAALMGADAEIESLERLIRSGVARTLSPVGLQAGNLKSRIRQAVQSRQDDVAETLRDFRRRIDMGMAGEMSGIIETAPLVNGRGLDEEVFDRRMVEIAGRPAIVADDFEFPVIKPPVPAPIPPMPGPFPPPPQETCPEGAVPIYEVMTPEEISNGGFVEGSCVSNFSRVVCPDGRVEFTGTFWVRDFGTGTWQGFPLVSACDFEMPPIPTPPTIPEPFPPFPQLPEPGGCIPLCPQPEKELDCEELREECPCPETKIWVNCDTKLFVCLPEEEFPEGDGWLEVAGNKTIEDILDECRVKDEDEKDEFERPDYREVQPCIFLPPTAMISASTVFSDVVNINDCIANAAALNAGNFLERPISSMVGGGMSYDVCKAEQAIKGVLHIFGNKHCFDSVWSDMATVQATLGVFNEWAGGGLEDPMLVAQYNSRFVCPVAIPTLAESNRAYLTDSIDEDTWRCWTRANNQDEKNYDNIVDSERSRLSVGELNSLRRRKLIGELEYRSRIRQLGFIKRKDPVELFKLSEQIPFVSDIIRMMVRDADDENIVTEFGLDKLFGDKFGGQLQEWAEAQGMPKKYMQYLWRAHWTIPPPSQLFEMAFRLTGPNVDPSVKTTMKQIKDALVQQDIAPFWVDRVLALAEKLPTRRDILRMVEGNVMTQDEALEAYLKLGFNVNNANRLYRLGQQRIKKRVQSNSAVGAYARGELNTQEMKQVLDSQGFAPDMQNFAVEAGNLKAVAGRRKKCLAAIRKRYFEGEIKQADLVSEVVGQGLDTAQANTIAEGLICEQQARGKHASLSQLCLWFREGSLDTLDFAERLINIGWSSDDASRIIRSCEIRLQKEITAEEQRRIRERMKKQKQAEREAEKMARNLERALNKRQAATRKNVLSMKKRRSMMLDVAKRMSRKLGLSPDDVRADVLSVFNVLQGGGLWSVPEVLQMMIASAEDPTILSFEGLLAESNNLLQTRVFPSPLDSEDLPEEQIPAVV